MILLCELPPDCVFKVSNDSHFDLGESILITRAIFFDLKKYIFDFILVKF